MRALIASVIACIAALCFIGVQPASADIYPIHGHVLTVIAPDSAIVAIDGVPGNYGAQTRRFRIIGKAVKAGDDIDAYLDSNAQTLTEIAGARNTEGVTQSSIILDAAVFVLGVLILGGILVYIGKRIFTEPS
jgi:hypothetical protein